MGNRQPIAFETDLNLQRVIGPRVVVLDCTFEQFRQDHGSNLPPPRGACIHVHIHLQAVGISNRHQGEKLVEQRQLIGQAGPAALIPSSTDTDSSLQVRRSARSTNARDAMATPTSGVTMSRAAVSSTPGLEPDAIGPE